MRAYAWTHFILSPIQKGIQGGHAITEFRNFFSKVVKSDSQLNAWDDWNDKHKTMIILNGGDCYGLRDVTEKLRTYFNDASFKYPPAGVTFIEDDRTLGGLTTSVASIVHARYYIMGAALRKSGVDIIDYHFDRGDFTKHEIAKETLNRALKEELTAANLLPYPFTVPDDFLNYSCAEHQFSAWLHTFNLAQ